MKNLLIAICICMGLVNTVQAKITKDTQQFYMNTIVPVIQQTIDDRSTPTARQSIIEHKLVGHTKMDEQEFYIVYVKFKVELKTKNVVDTLVIAQGLIFTVKDKHIEDIHVLEPEILEQSNGFEFEI